MTYWDTSRLARDPDFRERVAAAAASAGVVDPHPTRWADEHQWQIAAIGELAAAYAYAVETGVPVPGRDESVITDQQITDAVTGLLGA